jgi:hypothetical protein
VLLSKNQSIFELFARYIPVRIPDLFIIKFVLYHNGQPFNRLASTSVFSAGCHSLRAGNTQNALQTACSRSAGASQEQMNQGVSCALDVLESIGCQLSEALGGRNQSTAVLGSMMRAYCEGGTVSTRNISISSFASQEPCLMSALSRNQTSSQLSSCWGSQNR